MTTPYETPREFLSGQADCPSLKVDERWVNGTYIVCGVFQRKVTYLDTKTLIDDRAGLFDSLRRERKRKWLRGICGYYAIPVYVGENFSRETIAWVKNRPKYRYAMWHEPVLYDHNANQAFTNAKWGLYGIAFRDYLSERLLDSLETLRDAFRHQCLPCVNGQTIHHAESED